MGDRTEYPFPITVNGRKLNRVLIDQHYKDKHPDVSDAIILDLVKQLNGGNYSIETEQDGFEYFRVEPVFHGDNPYRIILVVCITEDYLGVVNAFRVRR